MKRQIQLWGTRTFTLVLVVFVANRWGVPLYKQYFTPKKVATFMPTAKVKQGPFVVSFHEIGTLEAEKSVPVNTGDTGKIVSLVQEGTIVKPGDKIAEMDTTTIQREIRNQQLVLKNAEADVSRAEEEFRMLKLSNETELAKQEAEYGFNQNELQLAKDQLAKKERLAKEKLIPADQVTQAQGEVRSKQLTVDKGKADLELKKKDIASKENQKQAEVDKVIFAKNIQKSNLEDMQGRMDEAVIRAPAPGMVVISKTWAGPGDYRKLQAGDSVHHRQTLCTLPDLTSMQAKISVGESDAPKVKIGMRVLVRLEAVPKRVFHGTVCEISSLATQSNFWDNPSATPGRKNFEVRVRIKEVDPKTLKPGMTADAEFVCDAIPDSVFVPLESVIEKDSKTFVYVENGKRFDRTRVVTGKYNDNFIIITKGLRKGQIVALRDPTRPIEYQEAGASGSGVEEKKKDKEPVPIPDAAAPAPVKK